MVVKLKLAGIGLLLLIAAGVAFLRGMPWHWLCCAALGCSWIGDAMLARYAPVAGKVRDPFLAGMGAFAVAQILYISAFALSLSRMPALRARVPGEALGVEVLPTALLVLLLMGLLFWALCVLRAPKHTLPLKIAVLVYAELLCAMAALAFSASFTGDGVAWPLWAGGLLFMISDALIAVNLFTDRIPERFYDALVWGTYAPAQIMLLVGASMLY